MSDVFCEKHTTTKKTVGDCSRCDGDGFTQSDLEDMDDPTSWHNDGRCRRCKGTGEGFLICETCEEEQRQKEENTCDYCNCVCMGDKRCINCSGKCTC